MASIKDVAKMAGVGLGTASRVINNKGSVSPATKEKVLKAIKQLDYTPNEVARSFVMQSTRLIGFMVPDISNAFFGELTKHIEDALYQKNYKMLLCNNGISRNKELSYLEMLKRHQVAGIITISYNDYSAIENMDMPVVTIDRYINDRMPHVASDNYQGGTLAAEALIAGGATKIGYMGGEPVFKSSVSDRKYAMVDKARAMNIPYVVHETLWCENHENVTAREFVRLYPDVDGVFCSTDMFAAALYNAYLEIGKKVPEEVQIIGFDGVQKNDFFHPYISTIVQPLEAISKRSVELLDDMIEEREVITENIIPVSFRQGETSNNRVEK